MMQQSPSNQDAAAARETAREVIARHAGCAPEQLSADDTWQDIGIDSLRFIVMVLDVEQVVGRKIFDIDNVGKLATVGDILALAGDAA
jgi:acyl carrier protein